MYLLGTFIQFEPSFATTTFSYMGLLITDLMPIIMLVVGVLLVAFVIFGLIKSLHK